MRKFHQFIIITLGLASAVGSGFDHTHQLWTNVLKEYQANDGKVFYKRLLADYKKDKNHPLRKYLKDIQAVKKSDYKKFTKKEQWAYLANSYNALTVQLILDKYPVKSIKDIRSGFLGVKGPWAQEFFSLLDGDIKSLDPIEHEYLRPRGDARVHAAVNCASISCPRLRAVAFEAKKLDKQLDEAMKDFLADPTRNVYDPAKGQLKLSKIFDWFEDDFKKSYGGVRQTIEKYGPPEAIAAYKKKGDVDYLKYDWNLNEATKKGIASDT